MSLEHRSEADPAKKFFDESVTDRERAIFEAGIALAMIYHQFVGLPISRETIPVVEKAIEGAALLQPFRESVEVRIDPELVKSKAHPYGYGILTGRMLDVKVIVRYGRARAIARMRYVPELDYTLMYIERVSEE